MNLQDKSTENLETENNLQNMKGFITRSELDVESIYGKEPDLKALKLITEITIPDNEEPEQIVKLALNYPTSHLKGFEDLQTATKLHCDEYIVIE